MVSVIFWSCYYFAYKSEQRMCDHAEYVQAWFEYWDDIDSGLNSYDAIWTVLQGASQCLCVFLSPAGDDGSLRGLHRTRTWKFCR